MRDRFKITTSPKLEDLVRSRAQEMISTGNKEVVLDEKRFGKLSLFLDTKPKFSLFSCEIGEHIVYVGGNA